MRRRAWRGGFWLAVGAAVGKSDIRRWGLLRQNIRSTCVAKSQWYCGQNWYYPPHQNEYLVHVTRFGPKSRSWSLKFDAPTARSHSRRGCVSLCRPPDSGAPTAPCAHGSVPTQPAKDFGTRCHTWIAPSRPEGLPIPATTLFCPSKAASADGENGTNRSLRSRSRPFRCSKCKQTVERRSDPASGGRSGLVETVKVGSYGTLKSNCRI